MPSASARRWAARQHLGRDVGGDQRPARVDQLGGEEAGVAEAGGELEHGLAGLRRDARRPASSRTGIVARRNASARLSQPLATAPQVLRSWSSRAPVSAALRIARRSLPEPCAAARRRLALGTLKRARRSAANARSSSGVASRRAQHDGARSRPRPTPGRGRANTPASATAGCSRSTASTSAGATFSPPADDRVGLAADDAQAAVRVEAPEVAGVQQPSTAAGRRRRSRRRARS